TPTNRRARPPARPRPARIRRNVRSAREPVPSLGASRPRLGRRALARAGREQKPAPSPRRWCWGKWTARRAPKDIPPRGRRPRRPGAGSRHWKFRGNSCVQDLITKELAATKYRCSITAVVRKRTRFYALCPPVWIPPVFSAIFAAVLCDILG